MRRTLLFILTLVVGIAGGLALAVALDVKTFPGVDAKRTAAEPSATVTATATATTTVTATPTQTPSESPTESPSETSSPSSSPQPTVTASSDAPAPTNGPVALRVQKEGSFLIRTASGSTSCYLLHYFGDRWAECTVAKQTFAKPKRLASCEYDWAPQFTLKARATYGVCRSDANDRDSTTVLKPGEQAVNGPLTCVATAQDGVDCNNSTTGHGFVIDRGSYRLT
jgi:hypothetical protein